MLATGLVFVFGALVATLVALLLVPLVWRQAQRLARRDFVATLPASMNEIRAEVDRVRAEAAMSLRRQEILSAQTKEAHAAERAVSGRLTSEKVALEEVLAGEKAKGAGLLAEIEALNERLRSRDDRFSEIEGEHKGLRRDFDIRAEEMEALGERFRELDSLADERRVRLVAADTRIDGLQSEIRSLKRVVERETAAREDAERRLGEAMGRLNHLTGEDPELPVPMTVPEPEPDEPEESSPLAAAPSGEEEALATRIGAAIEALRLKGGNAAPEELADVRETIADLAAEVVRFTAAREGTASPLRAIIDGAPAGEGQRDLISRIRDLEAAAGESATAPAGESAGTSSEEREPLAAAVSGETEPKRRTGARRSRQRSRR